MMNSFYKKIIFCLMLATALGAAGLAIAQEETVSPEPLPAEDLEEVTAQDLGISSPTILPDSPFYFFKEWSRGIQSFFTFNPIAKARLKERFANEKLIELKKMVEQGKSQERIEKTIKNYRNEIEEVRRVTERIRETVEENEEVGKFLDKFIQHSALHQRVLQKLEEQVPPEVFEKIKEAREMHLERFGEVMNKLQENKEQLQERLEKNLQEIPGGELRKEAIQLRDRILEKVQKQKKELEIIGVKCGGWDTFGEIVCECSGRLDKDRCPADAVCDGEIYICYGNCGECKCYEGLAKEISCENRKDIFLEEPLESQGVFCITLWDPVCGKDGKTYSNDCFAKAAGVAVAYRGECERSVKPGCQNLWWYDDNQKTCQAKNFCGAYMYLGLRTFKTKMECLKSLNSETNLPECGGIQGIMCKEGYRCQYEGDYPDATGKCVLIEKECKPVCSAIGTRSEGWYDCNGELLKWDNCKDCQSVCKNIGTRLEGWYSSCEGNKVIKFQVCNQE